MLCFDWLQRGCEERCADDQFQCLNNLCIPLKWLCDGQEDCKMGEDERSCQGTGDKPTAPQNTYPEFENTKTWLAQRSSGCDGISTHRLTNACSVLPTCSLNEYVCASGGCVSASLRCDGHDNCLDGSDEVSAPPPIPTDSSIHQNTLGRARSSDICRFLSRQIGCVKECREDEFLCLNRAHCIPRRWRCDEVFDCMDHSDEENCSQGRRPRDREQARRHSLSMLMG